MSQIVVQVDGLSKQYKIGGRQRTYGTLRDDLISSVKSMFRANGSGKPDSPESDTFWALRDVSFKVHEGEVLGIIGRNGAGKSTLLKMLSRITEPTYGRIEINGRVSSLLEVGTGFHGELTGRENVYLNGTILGMKRAEIARKFDEIVDFADVEQFIDTPVKHYSSGMYLRLAFSVAAHLEPDILIVDEVLAVGDVAFQKKCLGKMEGVAKQGRTIFFVSHNMPAVTRLCNRVIFLDEGEMRLDGASHEVVKSYLNAEIGTMSSREWLSSSKAPGGEVVRLRAVRVRNEEGQSSEKMDIRKPVGIDMEYEVLKPDYKLMPAVVLHNEEGVRLFAAIEHDPAWRGRTRPAGRYRSTAWIPGNYLAEGTLFVDVEMLTLEPAIEQFRERQTVAFMITDSCEGDSARGDWAGPFPGAVRPMLKWNTTEVGRL